MTKEQRRATRYPLIAAAKIVELRTGVRINARTSDLSLVGCYVDTLNPLPPETEISLQITYEEETFSARGIVAYSASNMGMGIKFKAVEQNEQRVLERWVDYLSGHTSQALRVE